MKAIKKAIYIGGMLMMLATGTAVAAAQSKAELSSPGKGEAAHKPLPVVMFKINNEEFTVEQYARFLQANPKIVSQAVNTDAGKAAAVREMAATYLLRQALYDEGLLKKGQDSDRAVILKAYEDLAAKHFPIPPKPDEKSAYQYYLDNPGKYGIPRMVRLNQILMKARKDADATVRTAARDRAEAALKRIANGEAFADVAAGVTENPVGKLTRGDIGFLAPDDLSWLKPVVKDKKAGDLLGVVESPEGFEVLQITEERPALTTPYANVRDTVVQQLRDEEQQKLRAAYVRELAKNARWEIVEPTLKPVMGGVLFP